MSQRDMNSPTARRLFLARLGAGVTAAGAFAAGAPQAAAQPPSAAWKQDDWLDAVPGSHRLVFDTTTASGIADALLYANNFYRASESGYSLGNADTAVVIVVRHASTAFGFNDAMWAKYSAPLAKRTGAVDPKTQQPAAVNIHLKGGDTSIAGLAGRGLQFAVCQMATRLVAGQIAQAVGGTTDAIYAELTANLVPNSHLVAAGIVALSRAQERGYTLATTI